MVADVVFSILFLHSGLSIHKYEDTYYLAGLGSNQLRGVLWGVPLQHVLHGFSLQASFKLRTQH